METRAGDMRDITGLLYRYNGAMWEFAEPASGQPCPTCGRRVPMTGAERQRKWRAKKVTILDDKPAKSLKEEQRRREGLLAWDITQRELREAQ